MQSGWFSGLKRIERETKDCDIDKQYRSDKCKSLMFLFSDIGKNSEMQKNPSVNFPIGKYTMNTFRHAKYYVKFCNEHTINFPNQLQTLINPQYLDFFLT